VVNERHDGRQGDLVLALTRFIMSPIIPVLFRAIELSFSIRTLRLFQGLTLVNPDVVGY
jgi:hypothetical protein